MKKYNILHSLDRSLASVDHKLSRKIHFTYEIMTLLKMLLQYDTSFRKRILIMKVKPKVIIKKIITSKFWIDVKIMT